MKTFRERVNDNNDMNEDCRNCTHCRYRSVTDRKVNDYSKAKRYIGAMIRK